MEETARHIIIWLSECAGELVDVYVGGDLIFTATVGRRGDIKIAKSSEMAKQIQKRLKQGDKIEIQKVSAE